LGLEKGRHVSQNALVFPRGMRHRRAGRSLSITATHPGSGAPPQPSQQRGWSRTPHLEYASSGRVSRRKTDMSPGHLADRTPIAANEKEDFRDN